MPGRIPQTFVDDLLSRTDIVDVIDSRVPLKRAGREYKACCPFHEEKTPSFTVSQAKQFYHCFGCGAHGTAIGFLLEYEHMDFVEAVEHLAARFGLEIPREEDGQSHASRERSVDMLTLLSQIDQYFKLQLRQHPEAKQAVKYLKQRGLSGEIVAQFGIGYAPSGWDNLLKVHGTDGHKRSLLLNAGLTTKKGDDRIYDRFRERIMFPIQDHRGRVVGFGGRAIGDDEPKYLNSPETPVFHKGSELYGLYAARGAIKVAGKALVVEGYMDVVALAQFGIDYVVATLGTATTRTHLERVFRHTSELIFCFDGDRAGRDAAWRALETALPRMQDGRQIAFLFLPQGEDPDSMVRALGKEGFEQQLDQAVPLPDYLLNQIEQQTDLSRLDGRARFVELAKPLIQKVAPGALHELLLERVAQIAKMSRDGLNQSVPAPRPIKPRIKKPGGTAVVKPSLVRVAMALLVQRPQLAARIEDLAILEALDMPGLPLLLELIRLIKQHPDLSPGSLLERYRDTEHHKHLEKLLVWDHMIPEEKVEEEFDAVIAGLGQRVYAQQVSELLKKPGLTPEEKTLLRQLLSRGSRK